MGKEVPWWLHVSLFFWSKSQIIVLKGQELAVSPALVVPTKTRKNLAAYGNAWGRSIPQRRLCSSIQAVSRNRKFELEGSGGTSVNGCRPCLLLRDSSLTLHHLWLERGLLPMVQSLFIHGFLCHRLRLVGWKQIAQPKSWELCFIHQTCWGLKPRKQALGEGLFWSGKGGAKIYRSFYKNKTKNR